MDNCADAVDRRFNYKDRMGDFKWKIRPIATYTTVRYSILYFLGQVTIKADSNPIFIIQYTGNNAIEIRVFSST